MRCGSLRGLLRARSDSIDSDFGEFLYPAHTRADSVGPARLLVAELPSRAAVPRLQTPPVAWRFAQPQLPFRALCPPAFAARCRASAREFRNSAAPSPLAASGSRVVFRPRR